MKFSIELVVVLAALDSVSAQVFRPKRAREPSADEGVPSGDLPSKRTKLGEETPHQTPPNMPNMEWMNDLGGMGGHMGQLFDGNGFEQPDVKELADKAVHVPQIWEFLHPTAKDAAGNLISRTEDECDTLIKKLKEDAMKIPDLVDCYLADGCVEEVTVHPDAKPFFDTHPALKKKFIDAGRIASGFGNQGLDGQGMDFNNFNNGNIEQLLQKFMGGMGGQGGFGDVLTGGKNFNEQNKNLQKALEGAGATEQVKKAVDERVGQQVNQAIRDGDM